MFRWLIIFLIRKHLGLKKYEEFKFVGQKSNDIYYFDNATLLKKNGDRLYISGVGINYIISDECAIEKTHATCTTAFMEQ